MGKKTKKITAALRQNQIRRLLKDKQEARRHYIKAREYYGKHNYKQAMAEFQKVLEFAPEYPNVHRYIEVCKSILLETKKKQLEDREAEFKARKTAFDKAEKKMQAQYKQQSEDLVKYHYNRALSYDRAQKYKEAVEEYKKVLEIAPLDADTHYNLAVIYDEELEEYQKAVQHYRKY